MNNFRILLSTIKQWIILLGWENPRCTVLFCVVISNKSRVRAVKYLHRVTRASKYRHVCTYVVYVYTNVSYVYIYRYYVCIFIVYTFIVWTRHPHGLRWEILGGATGTILYGFQLCLWNIFLSFLLKYIFS